LAVTCNTLVGARLGPGFSTSAPINMTILADALLYFGSFTAILVLLGSVIAILLWTLKMGFKV
jgi:hypothetical protein